jgi:hypothetical protein
MNKETRNTLVYDFIGTDILPGHGVCAHPDVFGLLQRRKRAAIKFHGRFHRRDAHLRAVGTNW